MRYLSRLAAVFLIGAILSSPAAAEQQPIGRITASFGHATIESPAGPRDADLHEPVYDNERIVTNGGGITVLLASRVVVKIDVASAVAIVEGQRQTSVVLEHGTVHLYIGRRPADTGPVVLQDPNVRVESVNGVFLAHYDSETNEGYYACEHASLKLETKADRRVVELIPDTQVTVVGGNLNDFGELDRVAYFQRKQSLDRLGQSAIAQGDTTFRMRSRTVDTQVALSQLAAAGWISSDVAQSPGDPVDSPRPAELPPPRSDDPEPGGDVDGDDSPPAKDNSGKGSGGGTTVPPPPPAANDDVKAPNGVKFEKNLPKQARGHAWGRVGDLPQMKDQKPPRIGEIVKGLEKAGKADGHRLRDLPRVDDHKPPKLDQIMKGVDRSGPGNGQEKLRELALPKVQEIKPPKVEIEPPHKRDHAGEFDGEVGGGKGKGKGKGRGK